MPDTQERPVAFRIPHETHRQMAETIEIVRASNHPRDHSTELIDVVLELTELGLTYYFLKPLEVAEMGMMSLATAKIGLASARQGLPVIIRRIVGSASDEQILRLVDFMDSLLIEEA